MTLQDENKKLEELYSLRNTLLAKQEEYTKKIRGLGPLSSDAFDTYVCLFFLILVLHEASSTLFLLSIKLELLQ